MIRSELVTVTDSKPPFNFKNHVLLNKELSFEVKENVQYAISSNSMAPKMKVSFYMEVAQDLSGI